LDIEVLKTFLEVKRTRHFGRAAENLFVSQSTVSARISLLEQLVGSPLFLRVRNDLQLTPAGRHLVPFAESISATWRRARQEVAIGDQFEQLLVVGGMPSMWDIVLNRWLTGLFDRFPELAVIGEVKQSSELMSALFERAVDIAFMFEAPRPRGIVAVELAATPLVLVSSRPNQAMQQAVAQDYVYVDWGGMFARRHAELFPEIPSPRLRMEQGRLARDFVLQRGGSCYLARPMVEQDLLEGRLFEVEAPVITRSASALFHETSDKRDLIMRALSMLPVEDRQAVGSPA